MAPKDRFTLYCAAIARPINCSDSELDKSKFACNKDLVRTSPG